MTITSFESGAGGSLVAVLRTAIGAAVWPVIGAIVVGLLAVAASFTVSPVYTARTSFIPPQQQGSAAAALASLGALSSMIGTSLPGKSSADQYVALLQSTTIADRLIDEFKLMQVYKSEYRAQARKKLADRVHVSLGRKDGLITVEVDDEDPVRAAALANRHIDELRQLSGRLALTEAQQRRAFFDTQLKQTKDRLIRAQLALQASGFGAGALRTEPKAAAEEYARLKALTTAAEARLEATRRSLSESTPEVQQQVSALGALRAQLARTESSARSADGDGNSDYVGAYREFKYQESLFEMFARQYELARVDESREGTLIQVLDPAQPPELKSRPKRSVWGLAGVLAGLLIFGGWTLAARHYRRAIG